MESAVLSRAFGIVQPCPSSASELPPAVPNHLVARGITKSAAKVFGPVPESFVDGDSVVEG